MADDSDASSSAGPAPVPVSAAPGGSTNNPAGPQDDDDVRAAPASAATSSLRGLEHYQSDFNDDILKMVSFANYHLGGDDYNDNEMSLTDTDRCRLEEIMANLAAEITTVPAAAASDPLLSAEKESSSPGCGGGGAPPPSAATSSLHGLEHSQSNDNDFHLLQLASHHLGGDGGNDNRMDMTGPELVEEMEADITKQYNSDARAWTTAVLDTELEAALGPLPCGRAFDPKEVDRLVQLEKAAAPGKWMALVGYLKECVEYHAAVSVVPVPESAYAADGALLPDGLLKVHAELFLSPHSQHLLELIAAHAWKRDRGRDAGRRYFDEHLKPLRDSVPQDRQWLQRRFTKLEEIIEGRLQLPRNVATSGAQDAATEIKDYMFLYFPPLRPKVELRVRGREASPLGAFAEVLPGVGFRCFSCHMVIRCPRNIGRIRKHLEEKGGCHAVLPCTRARLALIPPKSTPASTTIHK